METEAEEFESDLGNVAVTRDHVEIEQLEKQKYEEKLEDYSSEQFLNYASFSDVQKVDLEKTPRPHIRLKFDKGWRRIIFGKGELETAENCFKCLNYRWRAFRQNYD